MLPTLEIGPFVLPTAGLVTIFGIWFALSAVEKGAAALELNVPETYGVAVVALVTGFVAARLFFVVDHWGAYQQNLIGIVWPLTTGFNLGIGLFVGLAAGFFYGRAKQLPPASTLDALVPGILVALITVSLMDFLAGPGYGTETNLPWSINLFGIRRHPVQLYEIGVAVLAILSWHWMRSQRDFPGQLFLLAAAIYSAGRLFVDAYRANAWLTESGFHIIQLISIIILVVSLFLLGYFSSETSENVVTE